MSQKITIEIPDKVAKAFNQLLNQKKKNLQEGIIQVINEYIGQRMEYLQDPFFKIGSSGKSDSSDVSENHDKYLYGEAGSRRL